LRIEIGDMRVGGERDRDQPRSPSTACRDRRRRTRNKSFGIRESRPIAVIFDDIDLERTRNRRL
jgi:hypothetical protein